MKSIKRGRGPSMMGAFGSAIAAVFGVVWTFTAMSMGAPVFFVLFGVVFVLMGIVQAVYNFKNATGKNRFSEYDITDDREEQDPFDSYLSAQDRDKDPTAESAPEAGIGSKYCPYCGAEADKDFAFCAKCGKKLPEK